ncbi:MAG TPA: M48 family metalloprotease [Terriglobales bacterium]|jgi:predicted Zn-dependent protease|nr:M48 family metalloprotease [Terriglobales bacterium]
MRRSPRLIIAVVILAVSFIGYYMKRDVNPVTGEVQHVSLTADQEVALGLESAPQMAAQFGGADPDPVAQAEVERVGRWVVEHSAAKDAPYQFQFTLLRDPETVNAFALPGGPVFITRGLLKRLENEAQLAGVLGHEVGHVVGRHAAEHIAKSQLAQGIVGAVAVGSSDEYGRGQSAAMVAAFAAQMAQLRYGRNDELESDRLGVDFMSAAGYDPRAMLRVMEILAESSKGGRQPEFMSTHPNPGNREQQIQAEIQKKYPSGVPAELKLKGVSERAAGAPAR